MRLVHTSDWHLGRTWLTVPLLEQQRQFLRWLAEFVEREPVDAIIIAGDVYDRALPPADAVALFGDALLRLARSCPVVLIPGNHDSATRLGFLGPLLELGRVHVRASLADLAKPVELTTADGEQVRVYGIPYLEPVSARHAFQTDASHAAVLAAAMERIRADIDGRAAAGSTVVVAHAFVTGAAASDSERDVAVGGVDSAPVSLFAGADYVALGHLHRPQTVSAEGITARYSGSPIAYSFSEEAVAKSITLIDISADGVQVDEIPVPCERGLKTIRGDLDDLLADAQWEPFVDHWVRAVLTDARRPDEPMRRLRERFSNVVEIGFDPQLDGASVDPGRRHVDPSAAQPVDVCIGFVEHVTGVEATADEVALLRRSVEAVQRSKATA